MNLALALNEVGCLIETRWLGCPTGMRLPDYLWKRKIVTTNDATRRQNCNDVGQTPKMDGWKEVAGRNLEEAFDIEKAMS